MGLDYLVTGVIAALLTTRRPGNPVARGICPVPHQYPAALQRYIYQMCPEPATKPKLTTKD